MEIPREKLLQIFITESSDIVAQLESDVLELEKNPKDEDLINSIFRAFHTVKGNSGMLGLSELKDFTHEIETFFIKIRKKEINPDSDIITIILESIDLLNGFIEESSETESIDKEKADRILNLIEKYKAKQGKTDNKTPQTSSGKEDPSNTGLKNSLHRYFLHLQFNEDIFHKHGIDPGIFVKDFLSVSSEWHIKLDHSLLPPIEEINPQSFYLQWQVLGITSKDRSEIDDMFIFVIDDNNILIKEISEEEYSEQLKTFGGKSGFSEVEEPIQDLIEEEPIQDLIEEEPIQDLIEEEPIQDLIEEEPVQDLIEKNLQTNDQTNDQGNKENQTKKDAESTQVDNKAKKEKSTKKESELLKVKTEKVDKLMNLISELVISQSRSARLGHIILNSLSRIEIELSKYKDFDMKSIVDPGVFSQFQQSLANLDRISREMQNGVLEIRMIRIGPTFNQFRRMVRDCSQSLGKEIDLTIKGEDTELDKNMIKSINDPLVHIIRNSIDHGIETSEERKKLGKDPAGKLLIEAYQSEGRVVISVSDDGKGLDKERIYSKAIKTGLVNIEQELTDDDIYRLIFEPGLSTAKKVTDISGRGVGMDVVKSNIDKLKGKIDIITEKGKGTTFKIVLPLTLAIIDGMLVRISSRIYIIPILSIVSSYRPETDSIRTVEGGKDEIIKFRDTFIPLVRLNEIFDFGSSEKSTEESLVIAVEADNKVVGILVDQLIGKQQIVMKGLEENYKNIRGISAATILGDGNVALILDIETIVKISQEKSKEKKMKRLRI